MSEDQMLSVAYAQIILFLNDNKIAQNEELVEKLYCVALKIDARLLKKVKKI